MVSLGYRAKPSLCLLLLQLNVLNNVSSSEDIKPLPGLPGIGNMNYPSTSPGSLAKHICAICGDRSSGRRLPSSGRALCNDSCPDALKPCTAVNVMAEVVPLSQGSWLGLPYLSADCSLGIISIYTLSPSNKGKT